MLKDLWQMLKIQHAYDVKSALVFNGSWKIMLVLRAKILEIWYMHCTPGRTLEAEVRRKKKITHTPSWRGDCSNVGTDDNILFPSRGVYIRTLGHLHLYMSCVDGKIIFICSTSAYFVGSRVMKRSCLSVLHR